MMPRRSPVSLDGSPKHPNKGEWGEGDVNCVNIVVFLFPLLLFSSSRHLVGHVSRAPRHMLYHRVQLTSYVDYLVPHNYPLLQFLYSLI